MGIVSDFKAFVLRGNVMDMAIGLVIAGAFQSIVKSLVSDILMPPLGLITGQGKNYHDLAWRIGSTQATIKYGLFIATIIDFVFMAAALFIVIKVMTRLQNLRKAAEAPPVPPKTKTCGECAMEVPVAAKKCAFCISAV